MTLKQIDGLPIIDAKAALNLIVNDNDVAKADRQLPDDCAVARAARRYLHVKEARVHLGRVYLRSNEANWVRYVTPRPLAREIIAFDRGGTFEPGEFTLNAPKSRRVTGSRQGTKKNETRRRGIPVRNPRRHPHIVKDIRGGPAG